MCGILAVFGCVDNSPVKRARIIELSRRYGIFFFLDFVRIFVVIFEDSSSSSFEQVIDHCC